MKFIDLSIPIYNDTLGELPIMAPQIEYSDHDTGAEQMSFIYPKIKPDEHLPLGKGWATNALFNGFVIKFNFYYFSSVKIGKISNF